MKHEEEFFFILILLTDEDGIIKFSDAMNAYDTFFDKDYRFNYKDSVNFWDYIRYYSKNRNLRKIQDIVTTKFVIDKNEC